MTDSFSSGCEGRMFSCCPEPSLAPVFAQFGRRSDLIQADKGGQAGRCDVERLFARRSKRNGCDSLRAQKCHDVVRSKKALHMRIGVLQLYSVCISYVL